MRRFVRHAATVVAVLVPLSVSAAEPIFCLWTQGSCVRMVTFDGSSATTTSNAINCGDGWIQLEAGGQFGGCPGEIWYWPD